MKNFQDFKIDKWIQTHASTLGSVIGAISLSELQSYAPDESIIDIDLTLEYGTFKGSLKLRERIAELYNSPETGVTLTADNVVITPGSSLANYLVLSILAGPGDHIICQYPTYSQLFLVPQYQGAEVSLWKLKRGSESWEASLDELKAMIRPNTKAIIINNPNNPTGAVLSCSTLSSLVSLVATHPHITLLSDEVFRPLFHTPSPPPPSLLSVSTTSHPNSAVTASLSKAYGLPGIRIGWIVSPSISLLERIMSIRHYTTLAVSVLDQQIATFALSPGVYPKIIERNLGICRRSIEIIGEWVERNGEKVEWIAPKGAGVAVVRVRKGNKDGKGGYVSDVKFAGGLVEETGVGLVPLKYAFGEHEGTDEELEGCFRISLGVEEGVLRRALGEVEGYLGRFE
ncbi:pyridoxal phosphate-dependent transferase [Immersiella caudata]|uniref:Pyridoxal phosphate-dependent transferase n=1 Tax=Immersiella caudata TaxID=314043 RepID=A0AA40BYZ9_9PEZI|nr:pyridoxal phosphate-dependent transferase [Immersiella caudata]